jgi:type II secretory pathway pseudopilin PulG
MVELLVALLIMSTFFGLSFANFRDFQRRSRIDSAVRMVLSDMQQAKTDAVVGKKPVDSATGQIFADCDTPNTLTGYRFDLQVGGGDRGYRVQAVCDDGGANPVVHTVKDVTLPAGMVIRTPSPNKYVEFLSLGQGAVFQGQSGNTKLMEYEISDTLTASSLMQTIIVTNGGVVYVQE